MPQQYDLHVVSNRSLTPHMRRIVLAGDALSEFPRDQESGYVKVGFSLEDGNHVMRSYTVRAFDAAANQITLDFVDHGDTGPASKWARNAEVGSAVSIFGPGEKKLADPSASWLFLGGDLSALPALSVNMEQLPDTAKGYAVIEVPHAEDIQDLAHPEDLQVHWVVSADGAPPNTALTQKIRSLPWLDGTAYPWFAGEFSGMRDMRSYFRDERGVDRRAMYLSCYWKVGDSDEGMKKAKRQDAEEDARLAAEPV